MFGRENVLSERYLRSETGNIVKDATGSGRRLDFVIKGKDGLWKAIEVTSKTARKSAQRSKELEIRDLGGVFIRRPGTKELLEVTRPSKIIRIN